LKAWNDSVDRREFIEASAGIAAIAAMPAFELLSSLSHTPAPKEVREDYIQQVRSAARMFTSWDHTYERYSKVFDNNLIAVGVSPG
jgi:hypothetical protein